MVEHKGHTISEEEAALYDRQIRLWGLDAQKRLRGSRVLIVGLRGLGAEICKNIVLAGVKSVTLLDDENVTEEDRNSQFLVEPADVGKNRALCSVERTQQLNPMVIVDADTENIDKKSDLFFHNFDVVCLTGCVKKQLIRVNNICHSQGIKFFAGDTFGYYGYLFVDLCHHDYVEEVRHVITKDDSSGSKKQKVDETKLVKRSETYITFQDVLEFDWSTPKAVKGLKKTPSTYFICLVVLQFRRLHGRLPCHGDHDQLLEVKQKVLEDLKVDKNILPDSFAEHCKGELSPVCAIVGGIFGQEIIKAVSCKDAPHNNFFFFNGIEGSGLVDCIGK